MRYAHFSQSLLPNAPIVYSIECGKFTISSLNICVTPEQCPFKIPMLKS